MKKGLKITLITLGVILGVLVLVSLAAGPVAKRYLEKHSVELCNRQASIGQVWVNIFTGTVLVKDLQIPEQDGQSEFLSLQKLHVNVSLCRLLAKKVYIQRIVLKDFDAKVIQNGKRFNFSDIIDLYANKPKKEKKKKSPWTVELHRVTIQNSASEYVDAKIGSHIGVKNMNVDVPELYVGEKDTHIKADMDFVDAGSLSTTMTYSIKKGDFVVTTDLKDFNIHNVQPYITKALAIADVDGALSSNITVEGTMKDILNMVIKGKASLKNVKIANADKTPLTAFSQLDMGVDKVNIKNKIFNFSNLELDGLNLHYAIFSDGNTISKLLNRQKQKADTKDVEKKKEKSTSQTKSQKSAALQYAVKSLLLKNSSIAFADYSVSPKPQTYQVSNIDVRAKDVKSGAPSKLSMSATLGQSGKMNFTATADVMNLQDAVANLTLQNVDITDFTPYALHYLAYPVEDGLLTFQSDVQIRDNMLDSQNSLDIYKPVFGKKDKSITPAAAKIPMRLALYAVTDRKGHVNLDLPVKGNITSPEFSFRKLIWKTFTNLLVKIAASPIDFIAKSVNNSAFKPMTVAINSDQLSMEQIHQLNEMAEVLQEKQEANLTIAICCNEQDEAQCNDYQKTIYNRVVRYLSEKGVSSSRMNQVACPGKKTAQGNVVVVFNIELPE